MEITTKNRTYLSIYDDNKILPQQIAIFASSGHGKGLIQEAMVEEWRKRTNGIVLCIADPKNEAEYSFVQYEPKEKYHLNMLRKDGKMPNGYKCKLYHPFTFNINDKRKLPEINFYTVSLKSLTREDLSILAETPYSSESVKLMLRVIDDLGRKDGIFTFLHRVQKLVKGRKDKKKRIADPKNFYLDVGAGTSKSITEIAGFMSPFKKDYFISPESSPYNLDWQSILNDNENYHVFLSMFIRDDKMQQFTVLNLLQQIINNVEYAKKPILIVIPEVRKLCPRLPQGYKLFLSQAISNAMSTIRSKGRGMSSIIDSQVYDDTDDKIKETATVTLFGALSPGDSERVCKAMQYKRETREWLQGMEKNTFVWAGKEKEGKFRFFLPSHMHKEPEYNWIEEYKRHFADKMQNYREIINYMRNEYNSEEKEIADKINAEIKRKKLEEQRRKEEKEEKGKEKPKKEVKQDSNRDRLRKIAYEMYHDESLPKKERSYRKIADKLNLNHMTIKKYVEQYKKQIEKENPEDDSFEDGIDNQMQNMYG